MELGIEGLSLWDEVVRYGILFLSIGAFMGMLALNITKYRSWSPAMRLKMQALTGFAFTASLGMIQALQAGREVNYATYAVAICCIWLLMALLIPEADTSTVESARTEE